MDLFVLCTTGELNKYRVPNLLSRLTDAGLTIHHFPVIDGCVTAPEELKAILDKIYINLSQKRKSVVW
jgi:cyclin-dependent kinase inhibitor 3